MVITISGNDDSGPHWVIQGVHGRQEELNKLNEISESLSSACILVDGCNGSGKTTLVRAVAWERKEWVFVTRKFERYNRIESYSALTVGASWKRLHVEL